MHILEYYNSSKIPKIVLAGFLLVFSSTQLVAGILNAESFLFGVKLGGEPALIHIFSNVGVGFASVFLLRSHPKIGSTIASGLFGYMLVNVQYIQNSDGVMIPTLLWSLGIIFSIIVFFQKILKM